MRAAVAQALVAVAQVRPVEEAAVGEVETAVAQVRAVETAVAQVRAARATTAEDPRKALGSRAAQ